MAAAYRAQQLGRMVQVLVEEVDEDGLSHGYTAEYMPCRFAGGQPGQVAAVRVTGAEDEELTGVLA